MTTTITISVTAFAKQCWLHAPQTTGGLFENLCDKLLLARMQPQNSSFENKPHCSPSVKLLSEHLYATVGINKIIIAPKACFEY